MEQRPMQNEIDELGIDWSNNRIIPAFQSPEHLDVYDLRSASYEVQLSVATLVGLINRPQPRVYLISRHDDFFWLDKVLAAIPYDISSLAEKAILEALLTSYRKSVQGLIIYDPELSDSINIATMLAGQQNAIIVSPTQAPEFQHPPYELPLLADLRTYKWRNRLQAYRWAQQHLFTNTSRRLVAGLDPRIAVAIRPFLVATRTFIYWLDPLNILPNPRAALMSERSLMQQILHAFSPEVAHLGWFIYEGPGVTLTSESALPVFASDYFSNLEVWTSIEPASSFPTSLAAEPAEQEIMPKVYLSFTLSEGDNLQYIQERMLHLWQDSARGSVPLGWTISPTLLQAAPGMAAYYAGTATFNDEFVAGPSGAGYMYPSRWPPVHLPAFLQRTGYLMQQMNLAVLEVLDSNFCQDLRLFLRALFTGSGLALIKSDLQQRFVEILSPFAVHGLLSGAGQGNASWTIISGVPVYQNLGIAGSITEALTMIKRATSANSRRPYFLNLYVLAWQMTPSDLQQVVQQLGSEYEVVTPTTLLSMLAKAS
jgi:hypothetical protein